MSLRCPYCHGPAIQATRRCPACQALHHEECWKIHGSCASCPPPARDFNPYRAPDADVQDIVAPWSHSAWELADRANRLAARLIDGFTQVLALLPGIGLIVFAANRGGRPSEVLAFLGFALCALALLALFGVNCYLLLQNGQTLGKKAVAIKIVNLDGTPASLGKIIGMRMFLTGILEAIPFGVGSIFAIVNVCMIFGEERRCAHDHIAGTIVVKA